jgi:cbb3-type cytochrome oxidase cytochrome c subunit
VRDEAWLRQLLVEPAAIFPDGQMPAYLLSEAQLDAIVKYLLSLR